MAKLSIMSAEKPNEIDLASRGEFGGGNAASKSTQGSTLSIAQRDPLRVSWP